ncbi:MAG TPA: hypothetical protein VGV40_01080 [Solirubrobacteraceae bacterium]|nr:hypothetical protein [Solirubrobacteraceae bacterium]
MTTVLATESFGTEAVLRREVRQPGEASALGVLQEAATVGIAGGGGEVGQIAEARAGQGRTWRLYVNGALERRPPAQVPVRPGDHVWFDLHPRDAPPSRAVTGAFPAPFTTGLGGERIPTRVECVMPGDQPCETVTRALTARGVAAGSGGVGNSVANATLRVLVGPWERLRNADAASEAIRAGPRASGVYATFSADARALSLLTPGGEVGRTLRNGTGLVAVTSVGEREPTWFVTGTDARGVAAAAAAFGSGAISGRFAVAAAGGAPIALPLATGRPPDTAME